MRVYLDMDNTLVDLADGWVKWLKKKNIANITSKDILNWDWISENFGNKSNDYWKTPGIYERDILPIPGSITFVAALQKIYGKDDVVIISNSARNMIAEKTDYAVKHFKVDSGNILHVEHKSQYTFDGVLIDDAPHNIINHIKQNQVPGLLFNYRNRWGWAKLEEPNVLIKTCINYADCITQLEKARKQFFKT